MNLTEQALRYCDLEALTQPIPAVLLCDQRPAPVAPNFGRFFQTSDCEVERVTSLNQLLEVAMTSSDPFTGTCRFEMILVDESLLADSGIQVLMLLKNLPETRNVPLLVVGDKPTAEQLARWTKAGAVGFLARPF